MMNVFLGILAVIFLIEMIGDKEELNKNNCTKGFIVVILGIISINVVELILHFIG